MEINIRGDPALSAQFTEIKVILGSTEHLTGLRGEVLAALFDLVKSVDPDVILMPDADTWMPEIRALSQQDDLVMPFSRNGKYRQMDSRSVLELWPDGAQGVCPHPGRAVS